MTVKIPLLECNETVLQHAEHGLIEIQGLTPEDITKGVTVKIYVNEDWFYLETNPVGCGGFVRAHLETGEEYELTYRRIR